MVCGCRRHRVRYQYVVNDPTNARTRKGKIPSRKRTPEESVLGSFLMVKTRSKEKRPKPKKDSGLPGVFHIKTTFSNTIVTVTDLRGNTLCWSSAGSCGFKGSKQRSAFAAQCAAEAAAGKASAKGIKRAEVVVSGYGKGRRSAVRAIAYSGLKVSLLRDTTSVPHNGCRPPSRRRV